MGVPFKIYDGKLVIDGGSGGFTISHSDLLNLDHDDHLQYYNKTRLAFTRSSHVLYVSPEFTPDDELGIYPDIAQALARADYLVSQGIYPVMVTVAPATYNITSTLNINNLVGLEFVPGSTEFDFTGFPAGPGNVFIRMSGTSLLKGLGATFGLSTQHPFTDGTYIEVDSLSSIILTDCIIWDHQIGSAIGLKLNDGAQCAINSGFFSIITSSDVIQCNGSSSITIVDFLVGVLLGNCIAAYDKGGAGPSITLRRVELSVALQNGNEIVRSPNSTITISPGFGRDFHSAEDEVESSTTSATPQQKLRLTFDLVQNAGGGQIGLGYYIIQWSFETTNSTTTSETRTRVELDDTETLCETNYEPEDANFYQQFSGFAIRELSPGTHFVDIDFWARGVGDTAYIRRARLAVWRVS